MPPESIRCRILRLERLLSGIDVIGQAVRSPARAYTPSHHLVLRVEPGNEPLDGSQVAAIAILDQKKRDLPHIQHPGERLRRCREGVVELVTGIARESEHVEQGQGAALLPVFRMAQRK